MKGLESRFIYGLMILVAVIILIAIIVFVPSLSFIDFTKSKTGFEEFCVFWSLNNYKEGFSEDIIVNGNNYGNPGKDDGHHCYYALGKNSIITPVTSLTPADLDWCKRCCKKEITC